MKFQSVTRVSIYKRLTSVTHIAIGIIEIFFKVSKRDSVSCHVDVFYYFVTKYVRFVLINKAYKYQKVGEGKS